MVSETVLDHFDSLDDFTDLLADAEYAAGTDWEVGFTEDMRAHYDQWGGDRMFLSDAQASRLRKIATGE